MRENVFNKEIEEQTKLAVKEFEEEWEKIQNSKLSEIEKLKLKMRLMNYIETKRNLKKINLGNRSQYNDLYSYIEEYWEQNPDVQDAIKEIREREIANMAISYKSYLYSSESPLKEFLKVEKEMKNKLEYFKKYYSKNEREQLRYVDEFSEIEELRKLIYKYKEDTDSGEKIEEFLNNLLGVKLSNRINDERDFVAQCRLYEKYRNYIEKKKKSGIDISTDIFYKNLNIQKKEKIELARNLEKYNINLKDPSDISDFIIVDDKTEEEIDERTAEKIKRTRYDPLETSDFALVRSTDVIPRCKVVETMGKYTKPELESSYFEPEIETIDKNQEIRKFQLLDFISRRTSHWAINHLVGANLGGSFNDRQFIIIDNLQNHINNKGLIHVEYSDTWFEKDIKLSKDATILIPVEKYQEIIEDPFAKKELKKFEIVLFSGDDSIATKAVLEKKGYIDWSRNLSREQEIEYRNKQQEKISEIMDELEERRKSYTKRNSL